MRHLQLALALSIIAAATPAQAYIGPGAGIGAIAVVLGIFASIIFGLAAIVWFPIKRMMKRKKAPEKPAGEQS